MNFVLFLLLNAILFIRPEELFPSIAGLRLYLLTIIPCVVLSLPRLGELVTRESLQRRPIAACVLLFYAAGFVTYLTTGRIEDAFFEYLPECGKVVLYYFLLIAVVDTEERFRVFVAALVVLAGALAAIALAQQYGLTNFQSIKPAMQRMIDPVTGKEYAIPRMASSGIFSDPNDLCLIIGLGILSCVYCATNSSLGIFGTVLWLLPVPLFVFALKETHSKGGLMGVFAGGAAYLYSRFGGAKAVPLAIVGVVVALAAIGGRQADMSGGDTAHERLMMWAGGVSTLFQQPFFLLTGLGAGWFTDQYGLLAHNSFVQAYVETGLIGGGAFLGAFLLGLRLLDRLGRGIDAPAWVVGSRYYAFGALAGYAMGCYSLTRNWVVPTYLVLGIASVLLEHAAPQLPEKFQVNRAWFIRGAVFAVCGLLLIKVATQVLGQAGI